MKRQRFLIMASFVLLLVIIAPWRLDSGSVLMSTQAYGYVNSPSGGATGPAIAKFVDSLAGLDYVHRNDLGQYIPVAIPDTTTYPGSDYYELMVGENPSEPFHKAIQKLGGTRIRGYVQTNTSDPTVQNQFHILGPFIIAQRDRPVRLKFTNGLAANGSFFLPVDTTIMGAGLGPLGAAGGNYSQNRALLHFHGGFTPWISDGTPHQWITPAGETTSYPKGLSNRNVPDMVAGPNCAANPPTMCITPSKTDGVTTYFYTNQQSGRFMWLHDHSYGITRLNVYAGEIGGYILHDPIEDDFIKGTNVSGINTGGLKLIPGLAGNYTWGIPLIIQDKTFVPANISVQDPDNPPFPSPPGPGWLTMFPNSKTGDLWFPHVYEPNQNINSPDGINPTGRWDYGPWIWNPTILPTGHETLPSPSVVPEAFMDTPVINGTAYPYLNVQPKRYRFRILNGSNDRYYNLQLYYAAMPPVAPATEGTVCKGTVTTPSSCTEVNMVPANGRGYPVGAKTVYVPFDGRQGGVPDPRTAGPAIVQIGNDGGLLPAPAVLNNPPAAIDWDYDRRQITFGNIRNYPISYPTCLVPGCTMGVGYTLLLGPAERADIVIDFSKAPVGSRLIVYNDAPAPFPGFDPRDDYYTGDPDNSSIGGAPSTKPGYGPNTRTLMQFRVVSGTSDPVPYSTWLSQLKTNLPKIFAASEPAPLVPQGTFLTNKDTSLAINGQTIPVDFKAINEDFDDWGRMNATLGTAKWMINIQGLQTFALGYADTATEIASNGQIKLWEIAHYGVDTHSIHFHLFNVQVINRVDNAGVVKMPDPGEMGWKETVRMNPFENIIVAFKPAYPTLPFTIPYSVRPADVTAPVSKANPRYSYGWEYVWHCHLLDHEENDMMRPLVIRHRSPEDFDGDTMTDIGIYRQNTGKWLVTLSSGATPDPALFPVMFGTLPVVGDYDGDGRADAAVYVQSTGRWKITPSSGTPEYILTPIVSGVLPSDIPVAGDYEGDGMTDPAIYRTGKWYIKLSSDGSVATETLGAAGDIPVPGDYDGDAKTDTAVYTPSTGIWKIKRSFDGVTKTLTLGTGTDIPVPGDYDGDGKTDIAVYTKSTGTWQIRKSSNGKVVSKTLGTGTETPVPGDYDGDGITDIAVYNPSTGLWSVTPSSTGLTFTAVLGGGASDLPITINPASYLP